MEIKRIIGGWLESNCYIIYDEKTREGYIIDPGYEKKKYVEFVEKKNIHPLGVLLTHHHSDHSGEAGGVKSMLGCPILIHEKDAGILESRMGISPDVLLCDGDELTLGEEKIKVIKTPGHTMGSVCFFAEKSRICFTGDTVFNVDLGRTDLEDGSPSAMAWSIANVVDLWENDVFIYPGHGDGCTMGTVREINDEFIALARDTRKEKTDRNSR